LFSDGQWIFSKDMVLTVPDMSHVVTDTIVQQVMALARVVSVP